MRSRPSTHPFVLVCISFVASTSLRGQTSGTPAVKPPFATTAPRLQKVTVETLYYFTRAEYQPPVPVVAVTRRANATLDTPEETVMASVSAMSAGDFEWFRSLWTPSSRTLMEERDRKLGRGPGFWTEKWREALRGRQAVLTVRLQTGEYVLIGYRLRGENESASPPNPEDASGIFMSVLKKEKGGWLLTQDLATDPVLSNWSSADTPVKLSGREPPK